MAGILTSAGSSSFIWRSPASPQESAPTGAGGCDFVNPFC
jgi:hypothetical protein